MNTLSDSEARKLLLKLAYEKLYGNLPIKDEAFAKGLGISRTQLHKIRKNEQVGEKSLDRIAMFVAQLTFNVWKKQYERQLRFQHNVDLETVLNPVFQAQLHALKDFVSGIEISIKSGLFGRKRIKGKDFFKYAQTYIYDRSDFQPGDHEAPFAPYLDSGFQFKILFEDLIPKYPEIFEQFFDLLYSVLKTVNDSEIGDDVKFKYITILKSELNENQLFCLHLYSQPPNSHRFRDLNRAYFLLGRLHTLALPEYKSWVKKYTPIFEDPNWDIQIFSLRIFVDNINDLVNRSIVYWYIPYLLEVQGTPNAMQNSLRDFPDNELISKSILNGIFKFRAELRPCEIVIGLTITRPEKIFPPSSEDNASFDFSFFEKVKSINISQFIADVMFDRLILRSYFSSMHIAVKEKIRINILPPKIEDQSTYYEVAYSFDHEYFHFAFDFNELLELIEK